MDSARKINWKNSEMDDISNPDNYMQPIFDDIIAHNDIKKMLDLGCGNGLFTSYFTKTKAEIHGIDGSPYGISQALERGFHKGFHVENFDTSELTAEENYDFVICKDVLEHVIYPLELLIKANKKMSPDGQILVLIPNHFTLYHRSKFLFTNNIDTQNYFPKSNLWDFPHIRFMKDEDLRKMLELAGFEVVKDYSERFMFLPRGNRILRSLAPFRWLMKKFPNSFTTSYCLLARVKN